MPIHLKYTLRMRIILCLKYTKQCIKHGTSLIVNCANVQPVWHDSMARLYMSRLVPLKCQVLIMVSKSICNTLCISRSSPDEFMARVSSATKKKDANVKHDNYSERSTAKSTLSSYSYSRTKVVNFFNFFDI